MCNSSHQDQTPATKPTRLKSEFSVAVPLTAHCNEKVMGDSPMPEHKPIIMSSVGADNSHSVFRNFHPYYSAQAELLAPVHGLLSDSAAHSLWLVRRLGIFSRLCCVDASGRLCSIPLWP